MKKTLFISMLFMCTLIFAQEQDLITKAIGLSYIKPEVVLPALNPLLQKGETLSVLNNNLIVNVSPETLTKIRVLLHQLDVPPVTFLIAIHQGDADWLDGSDDSVEYSSNSAQSRADNQSVQVMSGGSAYISMANNYPVISQVDAGWVAGVGYQRMNAEKGMMIKPELEGGLVKITIERTFAEQNPTDSQVQNSQVTATSSMIPLNKWVQLSQTNGSASTEQDDSVNYSAGSSFNSKGVLYIKVSIIKQ